MAVEAVKSVVIQKLNYMLAEESGTFDIVIADQLKEMIKALEETREDCLTDAERQENTQNASVKSWVKDYLKNLYHVEDAIDTFVLSIALQKKQFGFLMNYALFFNNLNAFRKLRKKMKKIRAKIKGLNREKPRWVEALDDKSCTSTSGLLDEQSLQNQKGSSRVVHINENGCVEEDHKQEAEKETWGTSSNSPGMAKQQLSSGALQKRGASTILELQTDRPHKVTPEFRSLSLETRARGHMRQPKLFFSYSYGEEELGMIGIGKDFYDLPKQLTSKGNHIVSLVGKMGSGKTTLARAIYRNREIKKFFKRFAWISVSKEYTKCDLLQSLLKQVDNLKDLGGLAEEVVETRLLERLKGERCLIVLDDVWEIDVWEKLKDAFQDPRNGSKIMVTTRDDKVATHANPEGFQYQLNPLGDGASWELFLKQAGIAENSPLSPDGVKQRILEICSGLPLHIVLLGGLLSTKQVSSWSEVLSSRKNWSTSDMLSFCYNDLAVHFKLCLLYLVLFPKEFDIPVRRLLRLWLAEGFVRQSPGKVPEDVAQDCFNDLVNRSFIQISKLRSDGNSRRCRLPGAVHDYLLPKAQNDIGLFYVHRTLDYHESAAVPFGVRRIIEYTEIKNFSNFQHKPSELRRIRSYLSFNCQMKDTPAKAVGRFLSTIVGCGFGLLRVLDLEGVYKPNLPDKLGFLFNLRYLGLRWTFLDTLPPSVGDLPYLETLDIKHTYISSLPNSIWKLKLLRHLNLNGIRLDMPKQPHSLLTGLLTLWGLFIDDKSCFKDGLVRLDMLCNLRELGLTFHLSSDQDLLDWIAGLKALQFLRLRSNDDTGRPSKLSLKPLASLVKLFNLNLMGNLDKLPDQHEFPPTLKVLTLSVSQLEKDPMPTLGKLPSLTVLRLLANSYLGRKMVCPRGAFLKLRVLKLWMLKELEEWEVHDGAMLSLKELNIRCCMKLKKIPQRLLKLETFEEIVLTSMPDDFTSVVQQMKSNQTSLTVKWLEFTPLPWERDATGSFSNPIYGEY